MKKLLVVCGPTATGKTSLALSLAKAFNGEVISADSRQIYKGMDIGTGKDLPPNARFRDGHYLINGVKVWGYDIADPNKDFSVAQYIRFADRVIGDIHSRGHLPILVGGTGLYIKGVVDGIPTAVVPRNTKLRTSLEKKSPEELFETLAHVDATRAASMNLSDRKNPRRLIRAIEIGLKQEAYSPPSKPKYDTVFIGLTLASEQLSQRITQRVETRIAAGIESEVEKLLKQGISWDDQAMYSLGYRQFQGYFEGSETFDAAVASWKHEEEKYAKRQITWFKKDKRIKWFDVADPNYPKKVEGRVKIWYS